MGNAVLLRIGDGFLEGIEFEADLAAHVGRGGPSHQGLDLASRFRLVLQKPLPRAGFPGLHRVSGGLINPCKHSSSLRGPPALPFRSRGWSGRRDSNTRPSAPKADALPGCATPRPRSVHTRWALDQQYSLSRIGRQNGRRRSLSSSCRSRKRFLGGVVGDAVQDEIGVALKVSALIGRHAIQQAVETRDGLHASGTRLDTHDVPGEEYVRVDLAGDDSPARSANQAAHYRP